MVHNLKKPRFAADVHFDEDELDPPLPSHAQH